MNRFPQLDPDAPPVPVGKRPRPGVEYGCGLATCADCYQDDRGSWVIVSKATGIAVFETFSAAVAVNVNTDRYQVVPILAYLQNLNRQIRETMQ